MVSGDGMLILNSMNVLAHTWSVVSAIISFVTSIVFIVGLFMPDRYRKIAMAFIGVAVLGCVTNIGIRCSKECKTTQYQVIFDDTVSANDVYDNYDVVKIDGKLWTIREKV